MIKEFAKGCDFVVFGAVYCKYCKLAKELIQKSNNTLSYVDVDDFTHSQVKENLKEKLKEINNVKTIPIIYKKYDDEYLFIGGYKELQNYL